MMWKMMTTNQLVIHILLNIDINNLSEKDVIQRRKILRAAKFKELILNLG